MSGTKSTRLLAEERRRKILDLLESNGQVTILHLAQEFDVSPVTARADLDYLAGAGALVRSHGGAIRKKEASQDYPLRIKETLHQAEKARIGQAAARMVQPHETIIVDSGSTTAELARQLKMMKLPSLTVVTNALNIAMEFADAPTVSLVMVGGVLRQLSKSFVGPQAEAMLREMRADRLFLAVDGLEPEGGPSTPDILEAQLNSVMMQVAREVNIVADASKLGRRSLSRIGPISAVHRVITDTSADPAMVDALRQRGVEVVLA